MPLGFDSLRGHHVVIINYSWNRRVLWRTTRLENEVPFGAGFDSQRFRSWKVNQRGADAGRYPVGTKVWASSALPSAVPIYKFTGSPVNSSVL